MSSVHGVSTARSSRHDEHEPLEPPSRSPNAARVKQSPKQPDASSQSVAVASLVRGHQAATGAPSAASRFVAIHRPQATSEPSILGGSYAETKTEQGVHNVAIIAARLGMPTKVLDAALKRDAFTDWSPFSSTSHIAPLGDRIYLTERDSAAARDWNERSVSSSSAVSTAYHEAIHQYLLNPNSEALRRFVANGVELYAKAMVTSEHSETETKDPETVFHEAVAEYVGCRISAWVEARESLVNFKRLGTLDPEKVAKIASRYDSEMTKRVFGYETNNVLAQALGEDETIFTTQPLPAELRAFIDEVLLEGRIPPRFRDDSTFQEYSAFAARQAS